MYVCILQVIMIRENFTTGLPIKIWQLRVLATWKQNLLNFTLKTQDLGVIIHKIIIKA